MFHLVRGNAYLLLLVHRSCDHVYIHLCLSLMMYVFFTYPYMCYFTQRCLDEFCLKCFRNTSCQSLLAINFILAKFFKSLCYDRFYYIQQVSMSWVIYDFSHMFICLLWFCHGLPKGKIIRTYVFHLLRTYVILLCN